MPPSESPEHSETHNPDLIGRTVNVYGWIGKVTGPSPQKQDQFTVYFQRDGAQGTYSAAFLQNCLLQ